MDKTTTRASKPMSKKTICPSPACITDEKAMAAIFISSNNWGIIIGKPKMAISAACCCALAAIAAKKVNTRLRLTPPKVANPINCNGCLSGLPINNKNSSKLVMLISSISNALKSSFERIKSRGPAIE